MEDRQDRPEGGDKPLFVSDILNVSKGMIAQLGDIRDLPEVTPEAGIASDADRFFSNDEAKDILRRVGLGVIMQLEGLGSEEAELLREQLEALDSNDPRRTDLSVTANVFDEAVGQSDDPEEKLRLRRLGRLSTAVSTMAMVRVISALQPPGSPPLNRFLSHARLAVEEASRGASPATTNALATLLAELESNQPPGPPAS